MRTEPATIAANHAVPGPTRYLRESAEQSPQHRDTSVSPLTDTESLKMGVAAGLRFPPGGAAFQTGLSRACASTIAI